MKKQEMIERYGIEYYQEHLRKCKQYRDNHKEERAEYDKQHYQEHREERLEYDKRYRQEHREEKAEYNKQYYQTQYGRAAYLFYAYRQIDKAKGQECDLTPEWIIDNIFTSKCCYCDETDWTQLGTDRIDNTKGHTIDNVICCCGRCNVERGNRYSVEEFKRYKQIRPKIA